MAIRWSRALGSLFAILLPLACREVPSSQLGDAASVVGDSRSGGPGDGGLPRRDADASDGAAFDAVGAGFVPGLPPGGAGAVARWLVEDSDPPVVVRHDFFGLHASRSSGWPDYLEVPAPGFAYGLARSLDHDGPSLEVDLQWARIEIAPGVFDWAGVDGWIEETAGKTRIFTLCGTPEFYQKYEGEPWRYPYLPGGGSPPADPAKLAAFVGALLDRHPGQIRYVEIWNEPNFHYAGDTDSTRWDADKTAAEGEPPFYSGTPVELAQMARAVRDVLPAGVLLLAGAWEGQSGASSVNSMGRFSKAADGAGGAGRDSVQAFSFHHYIYNNDPNGLVDTIDGYRARLAEYGYAAEIEQHCSEIGHEHPTPASALSDADVARNIARATYLAAAMRIDTVAWYKFSSETTLKAPYKNATVAAALAECAEIAGRTIRQAALLVDGRVWLRLASGEERLV